MRPSVGSIVPKEWEERRGTGVCPVCAKPKADWQNKYQRIYCSQECNSKYNENIFTWSQRRDQILKRDQYTCRNCGNGDKPWHDWEDRYYAWVNEQNAKNNYLNTLPFIYISQKNDKEPPRVKLEVDHIKAYVNGGDMWSSENLQTLCRDCHVWKTKNDLKTRSRSKRLGHSKTITEFLA